MLSSGKSEISAMEASDKAVAWVISSVSILFRAAEGKSFFCFGADSVMRASATWKTTPPTHTHTRTTHTYTTLQLQPTSKPFHACYLNANESLTDR